MDENREMDIKMFVEKLITYFVNWYFIQFIITSNLMWTKLDNICAMINDIEIRLLFSIWKFSIKRKQLTIMMFAIEFNPYIYAIYIMLLVKIYNCTIFRSNWLHFKTIVLFSQRPALYVISTNTWKYIHITALYSWNDFNVSGIDTCRAFQLNHICFFLSIR